MRINVYTEELLANFGPNTPSCAEIVKTEYVSSRTGEKMANYGLRIYFKSHPDLHYVPPRDDDRSAVTIWCGSREKNVVKFWDDIATALQLSTLKNWREKTEAQQASTEAAIAKGD
jgi:hypothetical protein